MPAHPGARDRRRHREEDDGPPADRRAERRASARDVRGHGPDRAPPGHGVRGAARFDQGGLHGRRAGVGNRPSVRGDAGSRGRRRRPGQHLPSRVRVRDSRDHQCIHAVRDPDDARPRKEDAVVPPGRRRLADADGRRGDRVASVLHALDGWKQVNRHRNQSREHEEGRSGRHGANIRTGIRDPDRRSALARLWKVRGCDPADDMTIPRSHPRYESLVRRERLVRAWKDGVVAPEGLIAHGRGEAWDYLFGEGTSAPALVAERAAAAHLLAASHPVISVNGNVAALAAREVVQLARAIPARIEVNLFHRTESRVRKIVQILERAGARDVLGLRPNARIPGIESKRALSHRDGIFGADVALVPLEDGDRAEALVRMGKVVISVDLNPLSRTSQRATIPIADELTRAILNTKKFVEELKENPEEAARIRRAYRRSGNLGAVYSFLEWRPGACCRGARRGLERSPAAWRKVHDPRRHLSKHQHPWYVH